MPMESTLDKVVTTPAISQGYEKRISEEEVRAELTH